MVSLADAPLKQHNATNPTPTARANQFIAPLHPQDEDGRHRPEGRIDAVDYGVQRGAPQTFNDPLIAREDRVGTARLEGAFT
jgi:hypothetical protein